MQSNTAKAMKLVTFTPQVKVKFEAQTINRLFREGLDELHIYKPKVEKENLKKFIQGIDPEFHHKLVLHSHYSLVHVFDINRIHLGHKWRVNFFTNLFLDIFIFRGKAVHKSKTIHHCEKLESSFYGLDEVMLGPVFEENMYYRDTQKFKTDVLKSAVYQSKLPVTALGGVSAQTLGFFDNIGFSSVAIQSAIWKMADPVRAFMEIKNQQQSQPAQYRLAS